MKHKAVVFGLYKFYDSLIISAWKVTSSESSNPISKQIKINTIAEAIKIGFSQQKNKKQIVYCCAFKPEFLNFYLKYEKYVHGKDVTEILSNNENYNDRHSTLNIVYNTKIKTDFSRNRILFGAPGTGKSYVLNCDKDKLLANGGEYERITFHPDYSYAHFLGTYKPVPDKNKDDEDIISYKYVPGPFMRTYVKALKNARTSSPKPYLLIIEEINRANAAAVFGDTFQLLDRKDNVSEYGIQASEDVKKYLADELGGEPDDYSEIKIPDNMFIWATMNSADQGVFSMDTAFKRRWDFTYLGINKNEKEIVGKKVILGKGDYARKVEWNELRKAINDELLKFNVNEDKLIGPYFISESIIGKSDTIDSTKFIETFKNKVLMYLFDDAAKPKRAVLFANCSKFNVYSQICEDFKEKGIAIFSQEIINKFPIKPNNQTAVNGNDEE